MPSTKAAPRDEAAASRLLLESSRFRLGVLPVAARRAIDRMERRLGHPWSVYDTAEASVDELLATPAVGRRTVGLVIDTTTQALDQLSALATAAAPAVKTLRPLEGPPRVRIGRRIYPLEGLSPDFVASLDGELAGAPEAMDRWLTRIVGEVMAVLPAGQSDVLRHRMGLGVESASLDMIARESGYTREGIRQTELLASAALARGAPVTSRAIAGWLERLGGADLETSLPTLRALFTGDRPRSGRDGEGRRIIRQWRSAFFHLLELLAGQPAETYGPKKPPGRPPHARWAAVEAICANEPGPLLEAAVVPRLARSWRCDHDEARRLVDAFVHAGYLRREDGVLRPRRLSFEVAIGHVLAREEHRHGMAAADAYALVARDGLVRKPSKLDRLAHVPAWIYQTGRATYAHVRFIGPRVRRRAAVLARVVSEVRSRGGAANLHLIASAVDPRERLGYWVLRHLVRQHGHEVGLEFDGTSATDAIRLEGSRQPRATQRGLVLRVLRAARRPLTVGEIVHALGQTKRLLVQARIQSLSESGQIIRLGRGRYAATPQVAKDDVAALRRWMEPLFANDARPMSFDWFLREARATFAARWSETRLFATLYAAARDAEWRLYRTLVLPPGASAVSVERLAASTLEPGLPTPPWRALLARVARVTEREFRLNHTKMLEAWRAAEAHD